MIIFLSFFLSVSLPLLAFSEAGQDQPSLAAVVGSLDGSLSQYAAHLSANAPRVEMIASLEDSMVFLLRAFKERNKNKIPETIVVYRDGVADGQFQQVIDIEVPAIKGAVMLLGYPEDAVKIAVVVCQKRHHTRLVYEESGTGSCVNPCAGNKL